MSSTRLSAKTLKINSCSFCFCSEHQTFELMMEAGCFFFFFLDVASSKEPLCQRRNSFLFGLNYTGQMNPPSGARPRTFGININELLLNCLERFWRILMRLSLIITRRTKQGKTRMFTDVTFSCSTVSGRVPVRSFLAEHTFLSLRAPMTAMKIRQRARR